MGHVLDDNKMFSSERLVLLAETLTGLATMAEYGESLIHDRDSGDLSVDDFNTKFVKLAAVLQPAVALVQQMWTDNGLSEPVT